MTRTFCDRCGYEFPPADTPLYLVAMNPMTEIKNRIKDLSARYDVQTDRYKWDLCDDCVRVFLTMNRSQWGVHA